jgi:hypothetical protein
VHIQHVQTIASHEALGVESPKRWQLRLLVFPDSYLPLVTVVEQYLFRGCGAGFWLHRTVQTVWYSTYSTVRYSTVPYHVLLLKFGRGVSGDQSLCHVPSAMPFLARAVLIPGWIQYCAAPMYCTFKVPTGLASPVSFVIVPSLSYDEAPFLVSGLDIGRPHPMTSLPLHQLHRATK